MNTFSIDTIDLVIVIVYLAFIIWWGLKKGNSSDSKSYFLAGRYYSLSGLPAKAAELFKTSLAKEIPRKVDREEVEAVLKDVNEK